MKVLVTGASGQLGAYLLDRLGETGRAAIGWSGSQAGRRGNSEVVPVDLADAGATEAALEAADPGAVIHAAALSTAEAVRLDPARARTVNVEATGRIAAWCARRGRRLIFTSTDLVFGGSGPWNSEADPAEPALAYGRSKREAEPAVLGVAGGVVARLPLLYGPSRCARPYFFTRATEALARGEPQTFFEDEYRTPLDLATAARALVRLADSELTGLYHVAGAERVSRYGLMRRAAVALGLDPALVRPNRRADVTLAEPRPADVSLDSAKLAAAWPDFRWPTIEEALAIL